MWSLTRVGTDGTAHGRSARMRRAGRLTPEEQSRWGWIDFSFRRRATDMIFGVWWGESERGLQVCLEIWVSDVKKKRTRRPEIMATGKDR
jgi:hypothetical protein